MSSNSKSRGKAPEAVPNAPQPDPLDEALEETFPASDPVQSSPRERLAPADPPGSDAEGEGRNSKRTGKVKR